MTTYNQHRHATDLENLLAEKRRKDAERKAKQRQRENDLGYVRYARKIPKSIESELDVLIVKLGYTVIKC